MVLDGKHARSFVAATIAAGALAGSAAAQAGEQWYVTPGVGTSTQRFGYAMAVEGKVLVAGSPFDDTQATDAGAAFVYRFDSATNSWAFEQQLFASDAEASAYFGASVAVAGNLLVVGASYKDTTKGTDAGQAYVFRYDTVAKTWNLEQKLTSSVAAASDYFGSSVGVSGNLVVVGSPRADTTGGTDSGVAVVFRYKNSIVKWVEEKQLIDSDAAASDWAGRAVAIEGSTVLVSSHLSDEPLYTYYDAGSVTVWTVSGTTWTEAQELDAPTPKSYMNFGYTLDLNGDQILVGAPLEDEASGQYDTGAAYLFENVNGTWTFSERFIAPTQNNSSQFGSDVAIDGNLIAIGAQYEDISGKYDCGAAYLFRHGKHSGWVFDQTLGASDFAASDRLGGQVALNGTQILCAADGNDTAAGSDWGVIYSYDAREIVFTINPSDPVPDETIDFTVFRGTPGDVFMVTIESIDGTPIFLNLVTFVFAADHRFNFQSPAPNPAYGINVGMRAYKISPTGPVIFSPMAYVDV